MRATTSKVLMVMGTLCPCQGVWAEPASREDAGVERSAMRTSLYGYVEGRFEKVAKTPTGAAEPNGDPARESNPHEFDVPAVHVMVQSLILERYRVFLNLASPGAGSPGDDEPVVLRNAWVEAPIVGNYLKLRLGKTYRRFGLYNEQLDAVPDFPGIEPPELLDADHLMLTRTTNLMLHGSISWMESTVSYAVQTGNDERLGSQVPIGLDLRYDYGSMLRLGTSFYTSSGDAGPTRDVGDGSPKGGVANWMAEDSYYVVGGYAQLNLGALLLQAEYWNAHHRGKRDPAAVIALLGAGLNARQLARFGLNGQSPSEADVRVEADYRVETFYARAAYEFVLEDSDDDAWVWSITPYLQADFYKNPETIRSKAHGGDNEAGLSDSGKFLKLTAGLIARPSSDIALKLDGSVHVQRVLGQQTAYPEIRVSLAYFFELLGAL